MAKFELESLFVESGFTASARCKTGGLELDALPPFLRVLLTLDGTVTKALESFYWEPVRIDVVYQQVQAATKGLDALECQTGDEILVRQVNLVGKNTDRLYSTAESLILLRRLPQQLRQQLLAGEIGIGQMLRRHVLETYREILLLGRGRPEAAKGRSLYDSFTALSPQLKNASSSSQAVWRIYRVLMGAKPAVLIRENFFHTVKDSVL